jgi:hypothetical protein
MIQAPIPVTGRLRQMAVSIWFTKDYENKCRLRSRKNKANQSQFVLLTGQAGVELSGDEGYNRRPKSAGRWLGPATIVHFG